MPERRTYPRLESDLSGMLEWKVPSGSSSRDSRPVHLPVAVSSISCEGAGVHWLSRPQTKDLPHRRVTLHLAINGQPHRVPAMVAWSDYPPTGGVARVGLRLELGASPAEARRAFAAWIATNTAAARRHAEAGHAPRRRSPRDGPGRGR